VNARPDYIWYTLAVVLFGLFCISMPLLFNFREHEHASYNHEVVKETKTIPAYSNQN